MYLNIILTILVLVLITISSGVYFWWKKYGKKIFKLMDVMKNMEKPKIDTSMFGNMNDLFSKQDELFKSLNKMFPKNRK